MTTVEQSILQGIKARVKFEFGLVLTEEQTINIHQADCQHKLTWLHNFIIDHLHNQKIDYTGIHPYGS